MATLIDAGLQRMSQSAGRFSAKNKDKRRQRALSRLEAAMRDSQNDQFDDDEVRCTMNTLFRTWRSPMFVCADLRAG